MNEADRIVQIRKQEEARYARVSAEKARGEAVGAKEATVQRINELIPRALSALRRKGYPGAEMIEARRGLIIRRRAAWLIYSEMVGSADAYGGPHYNHFYFLSTGEFRTESGRVAKSVHKDWRDLGVIEEWLLNVLRENEMTS